MIRKVTKGNFHRQNRTPTVLGYKRAGISHRRIMASSPLIKALSISIEKLSTPEKVALVQMIEVSQHKRPQIDKSIIITQRTQYVFNEYAHLSTHLRSRASHEIPQIVAESILRSINSENGAIAYKKLLESK